MIAENICMSYRHLGSTLGDGGLCLEYLELTICHSVINAQGLAATRLLKAEVKAEVKAVSCVCTLVDFKSRYGRRSRMRYVRVLQLRSRNWLNRRKAFELMTRIRGGAVNLSFNFTWYTYMRRTVGIPTVKLPTV